MLSAALAGLAGALKAHVLGFATLTDVVWTTSGLVILMALVGGVGTMLGPLVGAAVVIALENKVGDFGEAMRNMTGVAWFGSLAEAVTMVIGVVFVLCVLVFRRGIVGETVAVVRRLRRPEPPHEGGASSEAVPPDTADHAKPNVSRTPTGSTSPATT